MNGGFAILAVAIATSGYILASKCLLNRYRVARQSGHRLYLSALTYGVYALFPALVLTWLISIFIPSINITIVTAALTVLCSISFTEYYNRNPKRKQWEAFRTLLKNIRKQPLAQTYRQLMEIFPIDEDRRTLALWKAWQKNDVELICAVALSEFKLVTVTLESRKVYVGLVSDTIEPSDTDSHLSILPFYSGHRDSETLTLKLNHKYESLIEKVLNQDEDIVDFDVDYAIAIPVERIVTINIFDEDIYQEISGQSTAIIGATSPSDDKNRVF